ncbi:hypothetical protein GCWU000325_00928 [Alloprevotella tannerae ATCC 51259]|uniref:Uncharacterized protein n=1 Tax=Alloprevotella tannerae ATCC 51259 TaxID=626522 RepID=C9LFE6_9BACT|nr:hypothetical protein GCWU000325_00928 [Alloprevotella tannerae ATCC 51259]
MQFSIIYKVLVVTFKAYRKYFFMKKSVLQFSSHITISLKW